MWANWIARTSSSGPSRAVIPRDGEDFSSSLLGRFSR
jgi:hypothetical protein